MKTNLLKSRIASIVSCFLMTFYSCLAVGAATPAPEKTKTLMEERMKTLEELVALTKSQCQTGQGTLGDYLSAENDLLEARIELSQDRKSRMEIYGKLVSNLKTMELVAAERVKSGVASKSDFLRVRSARLMAEIRVARELEKRGAE